MKKESYSGTWISLTKYSEMKKVYLKGESEYKEIKHNTEIKISNSILKV